MEFLPEEKILEICMNLSDKDLAHFMQTSKEYSRICSEILDQRKEDYLNQVGENIIFMDAEKVNNLYRGIFSELDIGYFLALNLRFVGGNVGKYKSYFVTKKGRSDKTSQFLGELTLDEAIFEYMKLTDTFIYFYDCLNIGIDNNTTLYNVIDCMIKKLNYYDHRRKQYLDYSWK